MLRSLSFALQHRWPRWRPRVSPRAIVALLLLASQAVLITGLPLPREPATAGKDSAVPYPCMHRPCGCRTAEQCWTKCCCFTPRERLAWAKKNGVQPPDYAVLASNDDGLEPPADEAGQADACCLTQAESGHSELACCESHQEDSQEGSPVIAISAWRCQGFGLSWLLAGAVPPPARDVDWSPELLPGDWLPISLITADTAFSSPPVPPPRV
jgi:hypothetical protein